MKTAIEEFLEELVNCGFVEYPDDEFLQSRLRDALQKEKQNIIDAYENGRNEVTDINEGNKPIHTSSQDYYNSTFNKK